MGFLQDYVYYSSGTECPDEFLYWSGISLLGHIAGNKVWVRHGDYFHVSPNVYIALVGTAGAGKNTALGVPMDIMYKHFPKYMLSADIQSREDVADLMASELCIKTWKDIKGDLGVKDMHYDYRPFYIINNELDSFLSVDLKKMMSFLTVVFDGKRFSTGFKGQRAESPEKKQWFESPYISMIAGAVPEWFMENLKVGLFKGGMGRRMIIVHAKRTKVIPEPRKPQGADDALKRCIDHLKELDTFSGELKLSDDAKKWFNDWYVKLRNTEPLDPILYQFDATKPMQVLKVGSILHLTERPFSNIISAEPLMAAAELLKKLEPGVVMLTSGIGRNELAGLGQELLDFIERTGGAQTEVNVKKQFWRHLKNPEFIQVLDQHMSTGDLIVLQKDEKKWYFSKTRYAQYLIELKAKAPAIPLA